MADLFKTPTDNKETKSEVKTADTVKTPNPVTDAATKSAEQVGGAENSKPDTPVVSTVDAQKTTPVTQEKIAEAIADQNTEPQVDELAMLKQRAQMMGIPFSNNIGLEALKVKVNNKINGIPDTPEQINTENVLDQQKQSIAAVSVDQDDVEEVLDDEKYPRKGESLRAFMHRTQMKLVRLRIVNLDPKKKNHPGEIFTVANEYLGTVRKFIPYGEVTDGGYHVEQCIYEQLKERKFLSIRTRKNKTNGQTYVETTWANEFALDVLPPLTELELAKLADDQRASGRTTGD